LEQHRPTLAPTVAPVYRRPVIDRDSLEALYSRYSRSVWRRARRMLAHDDAARDVTQEVFLRALGIDAKDAFETSPIAWLYRVTTNLCLNRLRDAKRRTEILSECPLAETQARDADTQILVRRILERVPEELQDIAVYYYVDDLSHDEIANILGVSRRTVGNRLATFHSVVREIVTQEAIL
jgi:RNA polymerase sigma factor (sigma-70 family)